MRLICGRGWHRNIVDDVQGFADAVESLAADPDVARRISDQAAVRVANLFNQKQNIDDLLALIEQHVPGVMVEKSAAALAAAIREMILYPELRALRSAFAQQYALGHFDQKQMIDRYEGIFRTAIE